MKTTCATKLFQTLLFATATLATTTVGAQTLLVAPLVSVTASPVALFATAAVADWTATYIGVSTHRLHEDNPMIAHLQQHPALMIGAGAGIDVAGAVAWTQLVGRHHPVLAKIGLYAATGFRTFLAIRNVSRMDPSAVRVPFTLAPTPVSYW